MTTAVHRAHTAGPGRVPLPGVDHLLHDADHPATPAPAVLAALHRFARTPEPPPHPAFDEIASGRLNSPSAG
ncbi:hypothetical protein [Amycolatopsis sp. lyj-109]|uniref:hypothetical protein n=1 Tax=Amycolatopsis sp. lyj-109 TaxID=2789287 RepID=UPI00397B21C6